MSSPAISFDKDTNKTFNSLKPSDTHMRQETILHWYRQLIVAWPALSHYLNQFWNIWIGLLVTNFGENVIEIHIFSLKYAL